MKLILNTLENASGGANGTKHPTDKAAAGEEQVAAQDDKPKEEQTADRKTKYTRCMKKAGAKALAAVFQITVHLPHKPYKIPIMVRQLHTCFKP